MQIIDNRALMFNTRKASQITALIPKSKVLAENAGVSRVLVEWSFDAVQILRNLGIRKVPSPIAGRYKWPGMFTPFAHQKVTASFLTLHPRCYVFSEAGTAKTASAAWAADYLMKLGKVTRVLVVCPVSIMDTAWRADLFRTLMHRSVAIAQGTKEQRKKVIAGPYEFVIINFDGVKVVEKELQAGGFDLIIVDEANAVKNPQTDRWKALHSLLKSNTRLWLMTGTPASQSPLDAYGLAKLVNPTSVPKFFSSFRDMVMTKVSQFRWIPKHDATTTVFNILQPAIRFTKAECLDLPPMLYTSRETPLTKQQQKYYDMIRKQMVAQAAESAITAANAASMLNKLLQISQGAVYTDDGGVVQFDISNRMEELMEVIEQTSRKILIFVPYRHVLDMLEEEINKRMPRLIAANPDSYAVDYIHGGVSAQKRAEIIKRFQTEDNPRILLLVPQATAHGITLTRADQIVWWGPVSSTEIYLQANARAHRPGQDSHSVTVTHLQGSPVERRMYSLLQNNIDMHHSLVELYRQEIETP